jgi:hypothetical protein
MLRRSLLLFATLGSLPRLESKGERNRLRGNISASVLSSVQIQCSYITVASAIFVSQGTASYGVHSLKQSMGPNRDVNNWLTDLDN